MKKQNGKCPHTDLRRLCDVGSDLGCAGCGMVMKAREWAVFKSQ